MDFIPIPIKQADLELPLLAAAAASSEGDMLDSLLAKLPLLKSVFDAEMRELKALIEDLGPDFADSPIFKDRAEEGQGGKAPLHYQGFLSVLNGIYADPKNAHHVTLTQFMEEHRFLMTEVLAKALLEKEVYEASGGKLLPDAAHSLSELRSQLPDRGSLARIVDTLLSHIQSGKLPLSFDVKTWIKEQVLENHPYIRYPDLSPSDIRLLLTTLGMGEEAAPPMSMLERVYGQAAALLKEPSTPANLKQFVEEAVLPRLESVAFAQEKVGVETSLLEALFASLNPASDPEIHEFLKTVLSSGEFPVIAPYTAPPQLVSRRARWRLRKRNSYFNASSMSQDEESEEGEEPTESRRPLSN